MNDLEYIRTDRNGTKYFNDWTCPRCGGAGQSDNWLATGKTCWACGGTGRRPQPRVVKAYTAEHQAKLDAQRAKREAKRLADNPPPAETELKCLADEARRNCWESEGFRRDGVGYIHTGNTYACKDLIGRAGGRWCRFLHAYVAPTQVGGLAGVRIKEVHAQDLCNTDGYIDIDKAYELSGCI